MIDLHSHIIPGIDDGARSIEDSIALLEQSAQQGVSKILFTPHITPRAFDNDSYSITTAFTAHESALRSVAGIEVAFACEARIHADLPFAISSGQVPLIKGHNGNKYLLLELPTREIPVATDLVVDWLLDEGITPIIAHPERNTVIQNKPGELRKLVRKGCMSQITAGSLLGKFGPTAQESGWTFIEKELAHIVASDTHNLQYRPNLMSDARTAVAEKLGESVAEAYFITTPKLISEGMFNQW
ncbi:tyrosine-protein phosphatase [Salinibius halmophilus]|uniref:tyrosine-protein phosphatase n=1 Tax=Salinibius halmophilus TaxID=1853216 RepID=UPI000E66E05C|nr:CpsB/CapC family capsule biosynthesis tyrosine phosphatase [Salinibius halmophilus]